MVSAARAPGGATASINADEIEAEGGSPSSRVSEVPTFRLHGKFMSRARLVHSKFRDEHTRGRIHSEVLS